MKTSPQDDDVGINREEFLSSYYTYVQGYRGKHAQNEQQPVAFHPGRDDQYVDMGNWFKV